MKSLLYVLAATTLSMTLPIAAQAAEYGATNLGGSATITWVLRDRPDANGVVGYACFTRDTLGAMSRDAFAHRYVLFVPPDEVDFSVRPLNAVNIYPSGSSWVAEETDPISFDEFFTNVETDETGTWFVSNTSVEGIGRSCVDGGMAGSIRYLERSHGINIRE